MDPSRCFRLTTCQARVRRIVTANRADGRSYIESDTLFLRRKLRLASRCVSACG
jgi:hypothetical protein